MTLVIDPEVVAALGAGYGPLAEATLGLLCELELEETAVVPVTAPTARRPSVADLLWSPPRELVLDDRALSELARETLELSQKPELRTWASSALSEAGRAGMDLSTETAVASTLLAEVQQALAAPLVKTARLGAALIAVGLHVTLVAHGQVRLTKALVAVYADGKWVYADPHGDFELGETVPFKVEKFVPVPDLVPPAPPIARTRQVQWHDARVQVAAAPSEADKLMEKILATVAAGLERETPPPSGWRPIHTALVVGALGVAALALWQVYEIKKEVRTPRTSASRASRSPRPRRTYRSTRS